MQPLQLLQLIIIGNHPTDQLIYCWGAISKQEIEECFSRYFPGYKIIEGSLFAGEFVAAKDKQICGCNYDCLLLFDNSQWYLYKVN